MKSCATCKHCEPAPQGSIEGECRHDTPKMDGAFIARWPIIKNILVKWCGEWDAPQPVETTDTRCTVCHTLVLDGYHLCGRCHAEQIAQAADYKDDRAAQTYPERV